MAVKQILNYRNSKTKFFPVKLITSFDRAYVTLPDGVEISISIFWRLHLFVGDTSILSVNASSSFKRNDNTLMNLKDLAWA